MLMTLDQKWENTPHLDLNWEEQRKKLKPDLRFSLIRIYFPAKIFLPLPFCSEHREFRRRQSRII
jgi:hypothetical protein